MLLDIVFSFRIVLARKLKNGIMICVVVVYMALVKKNDIVRVRVTGIQKYGAFATLENDDYNGLIHISEVSYGYVKDIHDFLDVGDNIYAEVVQVDDDSKKMKLSIKDIDYKKSGARLKRIVETKSGFQPLSDHLDGWINDKIKEITDNF